MIKLLRKFYKNTLIGKSLLHPIKRVYEYIYFHIIPEKTIIKWEFKKNHGYKLNLNNPVTFSEKIQWLKLNDRTPLHTRCADKYTAREYVAKIIGEEYLIPLVLRTTRLEDISPDNLPDFPVIIKTNHDSGGAIIIKNKSNVNWKEIQKTLKKRLRINYYYKNKEWSYKNISRSIIVEKLLTDKQGGIPYDYKFHCFHGKVETIQVDIDRGTTTQRRMRYKPNWEREQFVWTSSKKYKPHIGPDVAKPKTLDKMIYIAEALSKEFIYVRVDLYSINDQVFFGELTFTPGGGFSPFSSIEWDKCLGEKIKLPLANKSGLRRTIEEK